MKFDFQRHYSFSVVLTHGKHLLSPVHICDHVSGMRMSQTLCGNFVSYIKFYLVFGNAAYNKTGQNVSFLILLTYLSSLHTKAHPDFCISFKAVQVSY